MAGCAWRVVHGKQRIAGCEAIGAEHQSVWPSLGFQDLRRTFGGMAASSNRQLLLKPLLLCASLGLSGLAQDLW